MQDIVIGESGQEYYFEYQESYNVRAVLTPDQLAILQRILSALSPALLAEFQITPRMEVVPVEELTDIVAGQPPTPIVYTEEG